MSLSFRNNRHLVVLGGPSGQCMPGGPWSSITAVDGGGNFLHARGQAAHIVVGDGDSITPEASAFHEAAGAVFRRYPSDKDATDFELALAGLESGPGDEVHIVGMAGGRSDMSLGNLLVLGGHTGHGLYTFDLHDGCGGVMGPGTLSLSLPPGTPVALLALTHSASGIDSSGVRWPLENGSLELHRARGVSNVVIRPPWQVRLKAGALLWLISGLSRAQAEITWKPAPHNAPTSTGDTSQDAL